MLDYWQEDKICKLGCVWEISHKCSITGGESAPWYTVLLTMFLYPPLEINANWGAAWWMQSERFLTHWLPGRHSHRATKHGGVAMQNKWRKSLVSFFLTSDLFKHPWIAGLQSCDFDDARRWRKFGWRARNRNRLKSVRAFATNVNYAKHLRFSTGQILSN